MNSANRSASGPVLLALVVFMALALAFFGWRQWNHRASRIAPASTAQPASGSGSADPAPTTDKPLPRGVSAG